MGDISAKGYDISLNEMRVMLEGWIQSRARGAKRILILPPDYTRSMSQAGPITAMLYDMLKDSCLVDVMPALGTHEPMSRDERMKMFGDAIPDERFLVHNWRSDVVEIGEIPAALIAELSAGRLDYSIKVQVNRRIVDGSYDLVISVGQVVPHEVVGMANYTKNVLVGCGGKDIIDKTHFLGAVHGLEALMGRDHSPVRRVFDYAEEHLLKDIPLQYLLTVVKAEGEKGIVKGFFAGRKRGLFEEAVALSRLTNFDLMDVPLKKVVVHLDAGHYKSTWLGNKAIYRTRMAIADGGELIILAPGVRQFGEDAEVDKLIRKYGYRGTEQVLKAVSENDDLKGSLSAAAHLIHGSSEGRFRITYCTGKLTKHEVESVGFSYMDVDEAMSLYKAGELKDGMNSMCDGEDIFFISNPSLGLWSLRKHFE